MKIAHYNQIITLEVGDPALHGETTLKYVGRLAEVVCRQNKSTVSASFGLNTISCGISAKSTTSDQR